MTTSSFGRNGASQKYRRSFTSPLKERTSKSSPSRSRFELGLSCLSLFTLIYGSIRIPYGISSSKLLESSPQILNLEFRRLEVGSTQKTCRSVQGPQIMHSHHASEWIIGYRGPDVLLRYLITIPSGPRTLGGAS